MKAEDIYQSQESFEKYMYELGRRKQSTAPFTTSDEKIINVINSHLKQLHLIAEKTDNAEEYFNLLENANNDFADNLTSLAKGDPAVYPFDVFGDTDIFPTIEQCAANRSTLPYIPISYFYDVIQGEKVCTPSYVEWQTKENKRKNFVFPYNYNVIKEKAIDTINHIILSIMLAFPIKKTHITILDMEMADDMEFLTRNLDPKLFDVLTNDHEISNFADFLKKEYYLLHSKNIESDYELVVIPTSYGNKYARAQEQLLPFFVNGSKFGIYFFILNDTTKPVNHHGNEDNILDHKDVYQNIDVCLINDYSEQANALTPTLSFVNNKKWSEKALKYINGNVTRKISYSKDWKALAKEKPIDLFSTISVPVGIVADGEVQNFVLNCEQHTNVFVLGTTGYGKSVLLHDILYNMVISYSPLDLQLYLLDFKQGGPEFFPYRQIPHVRALLVDGNDEQVTLSILNDINEKMNNRGKLLSSAGVKNIEQYNRKFPDKRMPQIVMVVDECHNLFCDCDSRDNAVAETIKKIAREGRNQGVHFILATQTLSNLNIPTDVKNIISDHYLLNCDEKTSDDMVPGSSDTTKQLQVGEVLFHNAGNKTKFKAYFSKTDNPVEILSFAKEKYQDIKVDNQFYYSGSIMRNLNDDVLEHLSSDSCSMAWGYELSLEQNLLISDFSKSSCQNTLICGINNEFQSTGTTMAGVASFAIQNKRDWLGYDIYILNCLVSKKEGKRLEQLLCYMQQNGLCKIVDKKNVGDFLLDMCDNVASECPKESVLVVLGLENFDELRRDLLLPIVEQQNSGQTQHKNATQQPEIEEIDSNVPDMCAGTEAENQSFDDPDEEWKANPKLGKDIDDYNKKIKDSRYSNDNSNIKTYQEAMKYLLLEGPQKGVHSIIQTDKPDNLRMETSILNMDMFGYQVFHQMEESEAHSYYLDNNKYHFDRLANSPDRLRAYYHSKEEKDYLLMVPIAMPETSEIDKLLNK